MSKNTRGFVESVACPWCRKPMDLRAVEDYGGIEPTAVITCDVCNRNSRVLKAQKKTIIVLAPTKERGNLNDGSY